MRIFHKFPEAFNEIKRDLKEMGRHIENTHMQDKVGSFPTLELQNYGYTVLEPHFDDLNPVQLWADNEWQERLAGANGEPVNPGEAYKLRDDGLIDWNDYLHDGKFTYTYGERFSMGLQVQRVIAQLKDNPMSRQLYVSLWDAKDDAPRMGKLRVPCSLGWHFLFREDKLNVTYFMRSCDFVTHFQNDIYLTMQLLGHIAEEADMKVGHYSQFINSLHVYEKDVKDTF